MCMFNREYYHVCIYTIHICIYYMRKKSCASQTTDIMCKNRVLKTMRIEFEYHTIRTHTLTLILHDRQRTRTKCMLKI